MVREVIEAVRSEVGDVPIGCRISGAEFVKDGLTLEEMKKIALILMDAGLDMISVSGGVYESMNHMLLMKMDDGAHVYLATGIKQAVDVPVICAGNIRSLAHAELILEAEQADLVAMGRAQVADPQLVNKSKNGQLDQIVGCDHCQHCAFWLSDEPALSCPQNPRL